MYCSKCGTRLPDNAKFCAKCGENIRGNNRSVEVGYKKSMLFNQLISDNKIISMIIFVAINILCRLLVPVFVLKDEAIKYFGENDWPNYVSRNYGGKTFDSLRGLYFFFTLVAFALVIYAVIRKKKRIAIVAGIGNCIIDCIATVELMQLANRASLNGVPTGCIFHLGLAIVVLVLSTKYCDSQKPLNKFNMVS